MSFHDCFRYLMFFAFNNFIHTLEFSSVQSVMSDSATPWIVAHQVSLSITNSQSLFKLTSRELVMPSSHLILCRPLLLLPPIPPSIRVFSNESTLLMRWPKYWGFSFSITPSKEHPGLISFRMYWLDLFRISLFLFLPEVGRERWGKEEGTYQGFDWHINEVESSN